MSKKSVVALVLASLAVGTAARANDEVGKWYAVPQFGIVFPDSERHVGDGVIWGLGIGKHLSDEWSLEANGLFGNHNGEEGGADLDTMQLSIDALRIFDRDKRFSPYITAGAGWLQNNWAGDRGIDDDFMLQAGVGAFYQIWEDPSGSQKVNLRPELKLRLGGSGNVTDFILSVGLAFGFGGSDASVVPTVASAPAPAAAPAPPPPPPPVPAAVQRGPVDSDGDGVMDTNDLCPNTPRGTAVDAQGCQRKGSITLSGVTFENNSAKIKSESFATLDAVARDIKAYPRLKLEVQGHTDSTGADSYNLKLSQGRAESVREYLIGKGVGASQLTAKGYGETRPIADNKSAEGRAQNRRVVLDVLENAGDVEIKR